MTGVNTLTFLFHPLSSVSPSQRKGTGQGSLLLIKLKGISLQGIKQVGDGWRMDLRVVVGHGE